MGPLMVGLTDRQKKVIWDLCYPFSDCTLSVISYWFIDPLMLKALVTAGCGKVLLIDPDTSYFVKGVTLISFMLARLLNVEAPSVAASIFRDRFSSLM